MHVFITIALVVSVWKWGDWKNWKLYHSTMLFFAGGNLLYNFLTANYFLWRLNADFITNYTLTELLYTIIVFLGTILLFLAEYPLNKKCELCVSLNGLESTP